MNIKHKIVSNNLLFEDIEKIIAEGKSVTLKTKGNSMRPFIIGGRDSVVLNNLSNRALECGDIVLAKLSSPSRYVLHRVIALQEGRVTLMGDGNIIGKEYCSVQDIVARVETIVKVRGGSSSCRKNSNNSNETLYTIDPYCKSEKRKAKIWFRLLPFRRYLLKGMSISENFSNKRIH